MIHLLKLLFTSLSSIVSSIFLRENSNLLMGVIYLFLILKFSHLPHIHNKVSHFFFFKGKAQNTIHEPVGSFYIINRYLPFFFFFLVQVCIIFVTFCMSTIGLRAQIIYWALGLG